MRRHLTAFVMILSLSPLYGAGNAQDKSDVDKQAIQGKWKVVKADTGVGPLKTSKELTFTFTGDRLATTTVRGGQIKATFKLDATKSPPELSYVIRDETGQDVLNNAIYELMGAHLRIAGTWNSRAGVITPFPKEFKPTEGDQQSYVMVLEKVKGMK